MSNWCENKVKFAKLEKQEGLGQVLIGTWLEAQFVDQQTKSWGQVSFDTWS